MQLAGGCAGGADGIRLAGMDWRRGLLLAGTNLAIVVPAFVWQEARFWPWTNTDISGRLGARVEHVVLQEEIAVPLDPCQWFDVGSSRLEEVAAFVNLPAALLTGWHEGCLTRSALGRVIRKVIGSRNHLAEIADCTCLSALVLIQWVLVGGFPIVRPKRWWLEPGAFITTAGVIGATLTLIPRVIDMARIFAVFAGFGWLWWFGLLLWVPVHRAWQSTLGGLRRLSN